MKIFCVLNKLYYICLLFNHKTRKMDSKTQTSQDKDRGVAIREHVALLQYYDTVISSQFYFDPISENWVGTITYYL